MFLMRAVSRASFLSREKKSLKCWRPPAWAHRTLIYRELKGLQDIICKWLFTVFLFLFFYLVVVYSALSIVSPRMGTHGWPFSNVDDFPGATTDPINHAQHVKDFYLKVDPDYGGR